MSDKKASRLAVEIGSRFGETGERPLRQIDRMIDLMGLEWVEEAADRAVDVLAAPAQAADVGVRSDGRPRTRGGVFFKVARDLGEKAMTAGTIERRDFCRAFFDKAPTPKSPKPAPAAPPPPPPRRVVQPAKPAGPVRASAGNVRHDRRGRPVPQVEHVSRRAGR